MDSDYGNRVIDGLVIAAGQLGWTFDQVFDYLDDISTVRGMHEAGSSIVRQNVYDAIFKEAA